MKHPAFSSVKFLYFFFFLKIKAPLVTRFFKKKIMYYDYEL